MENYVHSICYYRCIIRPVQCQIFVDLLKFTETVTHLKSDGMEESDN